jgi:sec-independent protein translocase protein TatB
VFDIGFTELMVIGVVALIVIGPERLPGVARTVGHLAGRLQRYVADVKADISREMEFDELRKMRDSMQQAATEVETSVRSELSKTEQDLNKTVADAVEDKSVEDKSIAPETAAMPEPPAAPEPPAVPGASAALDVSAEQDKTTEADKTAAPAKQA